MKFFVDTADVNEIRELAETGLLDGVTTNPSLIAKPGRTVIETIREISPIVDEAVRAEAGIMVNVTLGFSANQALLAAKAGAAFISPFIGRLDDVGEDGMNLIRDI